MKRIFITGCGGMLGEAFEKQFKNDYYICCTDIDVNEYWINYLDVRDFKDFKQQVEQFRPDYIFHLAALTDLEYCEDHPDEAYQTNTLGVENAVLIANKEDIPILYISTAGIFDGEKDFYDDWDIPNPGGVYARSKYTGEKYVIENAKRYLICRAGWMMGGGKKDKKFIAKILKQIDAGKKELYVVNDKDGTPTYTHDFARNVRLLIDLEYWGLYNMVNTGLTNRFDVAKELVSILGLNEIKINPVYTAYFKTQYFAHRPKCERLINRKLDLRGLNIMRDWEVALNEYIKELRG